VNNDGSEAEEIVTMITQSFLILILNRILMQAYPVYQITYGDTEYELVLHQGRASDIDR